MIYVAIFFLLLTLICIASYGTSFGILFFGALTCYFGFLTICSKIALNNNLFIIILKKVEKISKIVFILWLISFIIVEILIISGKKSDDYNDIDAIIVLGAGINYDEPSRWLKTRLDKALEIANEKPDIKIIVTGGIGQGENFSESYVSKKYLIQNGIHENRIFMEEKSTNTFENIKYAKEILGDIKNSAVVSSDFHLFRARLIMKEHGLNPKGISSETATFGLNILYNIREYFSVIKHLVFER